MKHEKGYDEQEIQSSFDTMLRHRGREKVMLIV